MAAIDEEREDIHTDDPETDEESYDLGNDDEEDIDAMFDKIAEDNEDDETDGAESNAEDDELDESDDGEKGDESEGEEEEAKGEETPAEDETKPAEPAAEEAGEKPDAELEAERARRAELEAQAKKTLEALGIKVNGSALDALERAAAEAEGISVEDYRKRNREEAEIAKARELVRQQEFEKLAASDLGELRQSFPELVEKQHIRDCFEKFEEFVEFGRLRDAGVNAKKAYLAVYGDKVFSAQSKAAQNKAAADNKGHIKSVTPKGATDETVVMSDSEMKEWRELFPEKTDKEIRQLYQQTK